MAIEIALVDPPVGWELDTVADLFECLEELVDRGFRGSVEAFRPVELGVQGEVAWQVNVVEDVEVPQHPATVARLGDRVTLVAGLLRVVSADEWAGVSQ